MLTCRRKLDVMLRRPPSRFGDWLWSNDHERYVRFALDRWFPLYPVEECSPAWFDIASYRAIPIAARPSYLLAWPEAFRDRVGRSFRGRILVSLDGGAEMEGTPDVWRDLGGGQQEPMGFLRRFDTTSIYGWVQELAAGKTAWLTPDGRDLWQIGYAPTLDRDGRLVFDVLCDVRVGAPSAA